MALLPLLVLTAALLNSAAGERESVPDSSGVDPPASLRTFLSTLVDACLEGTQENVTREVSSELQHVQEQLTDLKQQLSTVQQQLLPSTVNLQHVPEQLTDLKRQLWTVQQQLPQSTVDLQHVPEQLTELKQQLSTLQQQLSPILPTDAGCPASWVRRGSSCYLLLKMETTWLDAHQTCHSLDPRAHLVSIHLDNKDHVNELVNYAIWIGLFRVQGGRGWAWTDGSPVNFIGWGTGEPNDVDGKEDCVTCGGTTWNDRDCSHRRPFLCQIKLN